MPNKNAVPQLVESLPGAKGIVGPWVHKYPHFAVPEPRIGFLQEALRWWDHWLKTIDTGVTQDPDYRAYIMDGARPQRWYTERPGRWVAEEYGATTHIPHRSLHPDEQRAVRWRRGLAGRGFVATGLRSGIR